MNTQRPVDPAVAGSIAVYDDKQKRILRGELIGIIAGTFLVLGVTVFLSVWSKLNIIGTQSSTPPVRAEFSYNYAGVQQVDYNTYLTSIKQAPAAPSAEAITAYNEWVKKNPNTVNVKVINQYLGADYNKTANIFGYMSAYVVPGVGQSCEYCHNLKDFSSDENPKKVIARNMLVMQFETQNKWVSKLPKPEGQPAYQLTCGTCHYGVAAGWNNDLKLKKPESFGVSGGGVPYDYNLVDQKYLDTRADPTGNVNYFQVTAKEITKRDMVGLAGVERNQNAMYHMNVALAVGCDFCHYGGYFPSYVLENGSFKWPKAQARHMMGMVQDLAVNWFPQMGIVNTAQPNCYMCHRGNTVPPGASGNAPKVSAVAAPLIKPVIDLPIPVSMVPAGTK
jgi:photosynthetic reaction center cytochrome c subunit